jgi:hypothetical protein
LPISCRLAWNRPGAKLFVAVLDRTIQLQADINCDFSVRECDGAEDRCIDSGECDGAEDRCIDSGPEDLAIFSFPFFVFSYLCLSFSPFYLFS